MQKEDIILQKLEKLDTLESKLDAFAESTDKRFVKIDECITEVHEEVCGLREDLKVDRARLVRVEMRSGL